jgi:hypothetical protein
MGGLDAPRAKRRWFWPTPAWLVYGAAVVTGVLFASERWRWFPVHYQKRWPVLLALAVVATVFILLPVLMLVALAFRRRAQIGLGALLAFVTLCAVVCSWLTVRLREARRQAEAVVAIDGRLRGILSYDWEFDDGGGRRLLKPLPPGPEPLRKTLGVDFFADVIHVWLYAPEMTDADMVYMAQFTRLNSLYLYASGLTDAGLSHLEGLTKLQELRFDQIRVTNERVKKLHHVLPNCKIWVNDDRRY